MARRIVRRRPTIELTPAVHHYLGQRMLRERTLAEEERDKRLLMEILATSGQRSDTGHRTIMLDVPQTYVDAQGKEKTVVGIQRQRRVSQILDEARTMLLLQAKGLVERCTETITVLSEDKVLAANYEGLITDEELKDLYDESETFAFNLVYD
jgi:hypothetical protein